MQLNQFGAWCIDCRQGVARNGGFIYGPGASNRVLCLDCAYLDCGRSRELIALPPTASAD